MSAALRVQETRILATRQAADWWTAFSLTHERTGRISVVLATIGGAVCDVACDDEEHARWLAGHMEAQGIPRSALKVIRVADEVPA